MPLKAFDLTGRIALVTGGNKGLGRAMAHGLAHAGADVVISARNEAELAESAQSIRTTTGQKCEYVIADMSQRDQVKRLASEATAKFGRIDILINNAGMNWPQSIDAVTDEAWDKVIEVNLTAVMALTRYLAPGMKERGWGRIVHISSILGQVSKEKRNAYSATKTALHGLARASALDLGPFGVTVNCLAPGPFLTDMPMSILSPEEKKAFADRTALGRWAQPDELVGPAVLLCSDAGSYVTGTVIYVDGGYTAR